MGEPSRWSWSPLRLAEATTRRRVRGRWKKTTSTFATSKTFSYASSWVEAILSAGRGAEGGMRDKGRSQRADLAVLPALFPQPRRQLPVPVLLRKESDAARVAPARSPEFVGAVAGLSEEERCVFNPQEVKA